MRARKRNASPPPPAKRKCDRPVPLAVPHLTDYSNTSGASHHNTAQRQATTQHGKCHLRPGVRRATTPAQPGGRGPAN